MGRDWREAARLSFDHGHQAIVRTLALSAEQNNGVRGGAPKSGTRSGAQIRGTASSRNEPTVARARGAVPKNEPKQTVVSLPRLPKPPLTAVLRSNKPSRAKVPSSSAQDRASYQTSASATNSALGGVAPRNNIHYTKPGTHLERDICLDQCSMPLDARHRKGWCCEVLDAVLRGVEDATRQQEKRIAGGVRISRGLCNVFMHEAPSLASNPISSHDHPLVRMA